MTKAILLHKDRELKRPILREFFTLLELLGVNAVIEELILALDLSKNLLLQDLTCFPDLQPFWLVYISQ